MGERSRDLCVSQMRFKRSPAQAVRRLLQPREGFRSTVGWWSLPRELPLSCGCEVFKTKSGGGGGGGTSPTLALVGLRNGGYSQRQEL